MRLQKSARGIPDEDLIGLVQVAFMQNAFDGAAARYHAAAKNSGQNSAAQRRSIEHAPDAHKQVCARPFRQLVALVAQDRVETFSAPRSLRRGVVIRPP